jgi:hypothetical protein
VFLDSRGRRGRLPECWFRDRGRRAERYAAVARRNVAALVDEHMGESGRPVEYDRVDDWNVW